MIDDPEARAYRRIVWGLAALVLAIGAGEVIAALRAQSRFLLRDGLEWGWDVAIFGLAAVSFGRGPRVERMAGFVLAALLVGVGLETLWQIAWTIADPPTIEPEAVTISAALIVAQSWFVVWLLMRFRGSRNPVIEATWLSSRNDAITGSLYALVTLGARLAPSIWPQVAVDGLAMVLALRAGWDVARDAWGSGEGK